MKAKRVLAGGIAAALLAIGCPSVAFADGGLGAAVDNSETIQADAASAQVQLTTNRDGQIAFAWNPAAFNPRNYNTKNMWCELSLPLPDKQPYLAAYETISDPNLAAQTFTTPGIEAGMRFQVKINCHQQQSYAGAQILNVIYTSDIYTVPQASATDDPATYQDVAAPGTTAVKPGAPTVYGHKLGRGALEFYVTGQDFSKAKKTVTLRLYRGAHLVKTVVRSYSGKTSGVDTVVRGLVKGSYTAKTTIAQAGRTSAVKTLKLQLR